MTLYERLEELRATTNLEINPHEAYAETESTLVGLLAEQIKGADVRTTVDGVGTVLEAQGHNISSMVMDILFEKTTKRFAVEPIISGKVFFSKFVDNTELFDAWKAINDFHTDLTKQYNKIKAAELDAAREAKKQEVADKKSEEKYEKQKAKTLKDFEDRVQTVSTLNTVDEFYYSLGWLAKHTGAVNAALPDYLENAFVKHFGPEAPRRVLDSKKRYPSGWTAQWAWSFTVAFKKPKKLGTIPAFLSDKLNPTGTMVSDTSFVWDLIDNYGFKFGKTQDIEKIRACVPADYLASFEAGLA
jgi:hypothetical protein